MASLADMNKLSSSGYDFIDEVLIRKYLEQPFDPGHFREVLVKAMNKEPLELNETATLIAAGEPQQIEEIFHCARQLKKDVYGNRIVLFAPLYIGNSCVNNCRYCSFRATNKTQIRHTLSMEEIAKEVNILLSNGHKRLILVYGEHPNYTPEFIAETTKHVYSIQQGNACIRRANINASPLDVEGYRTVKAAGIGTYQIFQETYHHRTYADMHPYTTRKGNYLWRLDGLARAMEGGCDDVGLGVLFGLFDWRFELLSLITHSHHLMKHYHVGPHTISFPRIQPASGIDLANVLKYHVPDADFLRLIAILRLSVPYTGLICTAREPAHVRNEALGFGVSQMDAGSRIEIGGYVLSGDAQVQVLEKEQFQLGDIRPLDEVIRQLLRDDYIPSFCTACYRLGRTGEVFMEYAIPGFIQNMCTPNGLTTLEEYLVDYASPETRELGERLIERELARFPEGKIKETLIGRINTVRNTNKRDMAF
ncbi:MAG: [FeFe] hydrogenase H-cluster radical SAM maturase HydG [Planctomycetaceae bacterium]|jgi:2-iminoacetate synthase|nr:[FeFe] hydrogenase H-cluster radical SAM maturase HydG [Planctomycetaceae bacterium]